MEPEPLPDGTYRIVKRDKKVKPLQDEAYRIKMHNLKLEIMLSFCDLLFGCTMTAICYGVYLLMF